MLRLTQLALLLAAFALVTATKIRRSNPVKNILPLNQPLLLPFGRPLSRTGQSIGLHGDAQYTGSRGVRKDQCGKQLKRTNCPLFDFRSNFVTKEDFIVKVMSEENGWFPLLTIEDQTDALGKCNTKWNYPDGGDVFLKQEVCYNLVQGRCDVLSEIMRITEDDCGRVQLVGVNASTTESIYSQDLNSYFWRDLCVNRDGNSCRGGRFFDLNVKGSRYVNSPERAADITGLPWDLIAADLRNVYDRYIGDPDIRHSYLGIECPFPG